MPPTVVIAYDTFPDREVEEELLSAIDANIIYTANLDVHAVLNAATEADALMVTTEEVRAGLIQRMRKCRIISRVGTGLDAIDVNAATERGIWVTFVPDYAVEEVSTHTIALLLAQARRLPQLFESVQLGSWDVKAIGASMQRLSKQTLGLVGFGRIGRAVAAKAQGLGLKVIAFDPYVSTSSVDDAAVLFVDLKTLLRSSDFVSLHAPLTDTTRHIINAEAIAQMKPTAFLINTARGALIDETALLEAMRTGEIAGAALDVLADEPPPPHHPFRQEESIIVTPHAAWCSEEAFREVRARASQEVVRVLSGKRPSVPANCVSNA